MPYGAFLVFTNIWKRKKKAGEWAISRKKKSKTQRATEVGDRKVESYDSSEIPARKET